MKGLPKEGWKTITIDEKLYERAKAFIEEYNKAYGVKVLRSLTHLMEQALIEFLKKKNQETKQKPIVG